VERQTSEDKWEWMEPPLSHEYCEGIYRNKETGKPTHEYEWSWTKGDGTSAKGTGKHCHREWFGDRDYELFHVLNYVREGRWHSSVEHVVGLAGRNPGFPNPMSQEAYAIAILSGWGNRSREDYEQTQLLRKAAEIGIGEVSPRLGSADDGLAHYLGDHTYTYFLLGELMEHDYPRKAYGDWRRWKAALRRIHKACGNPPPETIRLLVGYDS
jgi:hypothetical protein